MEPIVWKLICEECERFGVDPAEMLARSIQSSAMSKARVKSIRRVRQETNMSMTKLAALFNVAVASVWSTLKKEPTIRYSRDEKIKALWNTMSITDCAVAVGLTDHGLRTAVRRLKLPPLTYRPEPEQGHFAFTERCREILRQHGVILKTAALNVVLIATFFVDASFEQREHARPLSIQTRRGLRQDEGRSSWDAPALTQSRRDTNVRSRRFG